MFVGLVFWGDLWQQGWGLSKSFHFSQDHFLLLGFLAEHECEGFWLALLYPVPHSVAVPGQPALFWEYIEVIDLGKRGNGGELGGVGEGKAVVGIYV